MAGIGLPPRQLASQAGSAMVEAPEIPRSKFLNRFTIKKPFWVGGLFPYFVDELLPGDHVKYRTSMYVRATTMLFPNLDNLEICTFGFFEPMRLVWDNAEKFFGAQANPADSINFTIPQVSLGQATLSINSIWDHFGLPAGNLAVGQSISVNALPFRAYNHIYNEWFRDENLINSLPVNTGNGPDPNTDYALRYRAKAHDGMFTSALPWVQKFAALTVPLTGQAPITGIGSQSTNYTAPAVNVTETGGAVVSYPFYQESTIADAITIRGTSAAGGQPMIYANLSATTAGLLINDLRRAWLVQTLLERDARGGTRYIEKVWFQFKVRNPDFRLNRPEYIGGGVSPLVVTPIAQTATGGSGVGSLAAAGTSTGQHNMEYAATEHGYVIMLVNVRSELSYSQGLRRLWTRQTQYDFYIPALAGLGEQAVLMQELYCNGDDTNDSTVFGYIERWQEYRTVVSEVHGLFRPMAAGTLAAWHQSQLFSSAPVLGQTFIQENLNQMQRAVSAGAAADGQQFLGLFMVHRDITRPIPMYGTPVTLGRF